MKKTLLSVLAGIAVIGSASAVPSPEDLKKMCEKNPDKYVWVEKDKFCAPINPCYNHYDAAGAYCVTTFTGIETDNDSQVNDIIRRYIEKDRYITGDVTSITQLESKEPKEKYFAVNTSNGDYRVFIFYGGIDHEDIDDMARAACWAYHGSHVGSDYYEYKCGIAEEACEDVADFASYLSGTYIERYYYHNSPCSMMW